MRRATAIAVLLSVLGIWQGCSRTEEQGAPAGRLLQEDQVRILAPVLSKDAGTDEAGDFTLLLRSRRTNFFHDSGFALMAPRGCVAEDLTITGDWLGDDPEQPAYGYTFGPAGQEFLLPLSLTFILPEAVLEGADPDGLSLLLDLEDGVYEAIPTQVTYNPYFHIVIVRAPVEHFCRYLIGLGPPPDERPGHE